MLIRTIRNAIQPFHKSRRSSRRIIGVVTLATAATVLGARSGQDAVANGDTRTISLYHTHTRESISTAYMRDGVFDRDALEKLNWFLRDWRKDEPTTMDPRLFDVVWNAHREVGSNEPIHVVSAYRSPDTNAMLRRRSSAVAKHSQHMLGKAMDVVMPDVAMAKVREIGLQMQRGGVGWYPTAGTPFVHLDVGTVRAWPRAPRDMLARLFPDGKTVHIPTDGTPLAGYAEAAAEIEARGGQAIALAEVKSKGFWATLFGGGDDEDEGYSGKGRALVASRGKAGGKAGNTVVASLAPVSVGGGDRDDAVRSFMSPVAAQPDLANATKAPSSRLTRAGRQAPAAPAPVETPAVAETAPVPAAPPPIVAEPAPVVVASLQPTPVPAAPAPVAAKPLAPALAFVDLPVPPARPANFGVTTVEGIPLPPLRPTVVVASIEMAKPDTVAVEAARPEAAVTTGAITAPLARGEQRAANGLPVAIMGERSAPSLPASVAAFAPSDMPLPPMRPAFLDATPSSAPAPVLANVPVPPQRRVLASLAPVPEAASAPAANKLVADTPAVAATGVVLDRAGLDLLTSQVTEGEKTVPAAKVAIPAVRVALGGGIAAGRFSSASSASVEAGRFSGPAIRPLRASFVRPATE